MWITQAGALALLASLIFSSTRAILVNRTIDDTYGDSVTGQIPVYQPTNPWGFPNCSGCAIVPDKTKAFDQTWSAATYHPELNNVNITLSFTGVSVWVFFILANANVLGTGVTSNTQCNFTLDGNLMNTYNHQPDETTLDLQYNVTAFSATGLSNSSHQLVISTNDFPISVYINFDYAIYTFDELDSTTSSTSGPSSTSTSTSGNSATTSTPRSTDVHSTNSSSDNKVGIIVGCVLGGLALLVLVVVLMLFRRLRGARQKPIVPTDAITTFNQQPPPGLGYLDGVAASNTSSHLPSIYNQTYGSGSLFDQSSHIRSPSSDLASQSLSLAPFRSEYHSPHTLRSTKSRETEINQRLQTAQQEMRELISRQSRGPDSSSSDTRRENEIDSIREQIRELSSRIEHLQVERTFDGEHRSIRNSEPPPAYDT